MTPNCPLCRELMITERQTKELLVALCETCRHRCAVHLKSPPTTTDYHKQYDQGDYLKNLEETRQRQAKKIFENMSELGIGPSKLIDFGAGRGWFLKEAKQRGGRPIAGADTSEMAIRGLHAMGAETAMIFIDGKQLTMNISALSFEPVTITLLDVLEHFPLSQVVTNLRAVLSQLSKIKTVIIKVPIADGVLFRLASLLATFGWKKPYHQLFQVGTFPPHFHYFSKKSLDIYLKQLGFKTRRIVDDPDLDDLMGRINLGGALWGIVSAILTKFLWVLGNVLGYDTRIVFCEVT